MGDVNIVLCTDEHYAPYCAVVMLTAIIHCRTPARLQFHVLTPGLKEETAQALQGMVEGRGARLAVSAVGDLLSDNGSFGRFGVGTIMRLYMHRYLPADCTRTIYLDCDLLILDDIVGLWECDLGGKAVGAITDLCLPRAFARRRNSLPYCNAGVLLVDVSLWRERAIGEGALAYLQENVKTLTYLDQDALNHVLAGQWCSLDLAWNFQTTAYRALEKHFGYLEDRWRELKLAVKRPKIVHFIGNRKPWHAQCTHPLKHLFVHFSSYTPWPIDAAALTLAVPLRQRIRDVGKTFRAWRRRRHLVYQLPDMRLTSGPIDGQAAS